MIDKPLRMTSMTAVSIVRRKAGGAKTGHAGTLDPLATGVLVIAIGKATRSIDKLMATDKRYETVIDLSAFTTTDDLEGTRTQVVAAPPTVEKVQATLEQFKGEIMQQPPAFSAMKINGRRAYKMARKGEAVEIPARPVIVHSMQLVNYEWPRLELLIHCAKGFYVRSLARELGQALGTGGHCTLIRRTAVGPFTIDNALALVDVPPALSQEDLITVENAERMLVK